MICVAFFSKFCQVASRHRPHLELLDYSSFLPTYFSLLVTSHHGAVGGASAWQTRGRRFEPGLMRSNFNGKYPGA